MQRMAPVLRAAIALTLLLAFAAPAGAEDQVWDYNYIPNLKYTDWRISDDYSTITFGADETYSLGSVLSRSRDGRYAFFHWWGEFLCQDGPQYQYTPAEYYEQQVRPMVRETVERIGADFPSQEIILIDGRPWQETEWADEYLAVIPAEYHDLARDVTLNGWLHDIIVLGVPAEKVRQLPREITPTAASKYRLYKTIDDFAADGGHRYFWSPAMQTVTVPAGQIARLDAALERGATDEAAPQEQIQPVTTKRSRIVMYLNNPVIEVTSFIGTPREVSGTRTLDQAPINPNGHTLIPIRAVFEPLGGNVVWNPEAGAVKIEAYPKAVHLTAWSNVAAVQTLGPGGSIQQVEMPDAVRIVNGTMLVPLRFVAETFGFQVDWDGELQKITIEAEQQF